MKIDNIQPNSDFMAQFLAKQDMPKREMTAFSELVAKPQKDTFVKSEVKEEEVKQQPADETIKDQEESEEEVNNVQEQPQEDAQVEEIKEEKTEEEVPEEQQNHQGEENVKKKTNIIDKIKNFFKNLFIKKKPNETNAEETAKYSSAGSTN